MSDRERFLKTMGSGIPDRAPYWECAFWNETYNRWAEEGLPDSVIHPGGSNTGPTEESLRLFFGFDKNFGIYFRNTAHINIGLYPPFKPQKLSEENGIITALGGDGVILRYSPHGHSTKQFVKFPVENKEDFEKIKEKLNPQTSGRFAPGWKEYAQKLQNEDAPICIRVGGYYGFARSLMGLENLSYAFYEQPELIEEIFEYRTEYMCIILEKALKDIKPDFAEFWEDMAFKTGPLVSPALYRKLSLKHYRKITDLLSKHGVNIILLDSDGNVDDLIPIWLDGGINCIWPLEIAAGMDPIKIRKKYGNSLGLIGGIDKRALAAGKDEIRTEVMSKVPFLYKTGKYIPTCDHAVPPDVSFDNYMYYLNLICEINGRKDDLFERL